MADITTEVLIIGTGPSGTATAALLSSYGIRNMAVNRYRWLANTPRAHITNQRAMEVLRDLGREVEDEAYMFATHQDLMGENIFCESLAGEEIGRMKSWGNHPLSRAEHLMSSPTQMNDLPQTFMEPLLFKTACSRGTQARMSTEYLRHEQDAEGVTTTCLDRLTGKELHHPVEIPDRRRWRQIAGGRTRRPAVRGQDGRRRQHEHPVPRRPVEVCRPPAFGPVLGDAARRRRRRHRHGPGAHGAGPGTNG
jgi:hypothetical protein